MLDTDNRDCVRKYNALLSLYFHIPFPEELDDELWAEKVAQLRWLSKNGILGVKTNKEET